MKYIWLLTALSVIACEKGSPPFEGLPDAETVTNEPPNAEPQDLEANIDPVAKATRDFVAVMFEDGTSLRKKRRAVAAVKGRVAGGVREKGTDGIYIIRIARNATTMTPSSQACNTLYRMKFVVYCRAPALHSLSDPGISRGDTVR